MPKYVIPEKMALKPFFTEGEMIEISIPETFHEAMTSGYFILDLLAEKTPYYPWIEQQKLLPDIFAIWKSEKESLRDMIAKRQKRLAELPMRQQLANLLNVLFWLNGEQITSLQDWKQRVAMFDLQPVNAHERLIFIMERPVHHHAFIQLEQLYVELEKLMQKQFAIYNKQN
ncbi:YpoC family protein [Bacillus solimangrovi]|uniref:YpoC family protein n=1 Tax=Bacillus solimangrovi TaxID=1305675 RepID=UPI0009F34E4A|nr:hypothetical protein [Bacillus solimangrovi]